MTYVCQTCGYRFKTKEEADVAAVSGCPDCGSTYIDEAPVRVRKAFRGLKR